MRGITKIGVALFLMFAVHQNIKAQSCFGGTSMTSNTTDVLCNGDSTGTITLTLAGGSPPYLFRIITPEPELNEDVITNDPTYTFTGLPVVASGYLVIGQAAPTNPSTFLCSDNVFINEPSALTSNGVITDNNCAGGSSGAIDISVSGATPTYSYSWSNGASSEDVTGLQAGDYWVEITDGNGCTKTDTFTVSEPPPFSFSGSVINVSCNGLSDGAVIISPPSSGGPYSYSWSDGQSSQNASGLPAGDITVTVTDDNTGCGQDSTYTVNEPLPITIADVITDASCNTGADGAIALTPSGGTGPYSYTWSNGDNSNNPTGLTAGTYTVTVTDNNGCTENGSYTVNEPTPIVITETINNVSCNGFSDGNASVVVSGGTPGYSYAWSNGATADNVSGLAAGAISITVTDNNGCPATENYTVGEPLVLTLSDVVTNVTCNGGSDGSIDLTTNGGTTPYSYVWSNGASSEDLNSLSTGTYTVTVTDINGCTVNGNYTINEPSLFNINGFIFDVSCNGLSDGIVQASASGSSTPYSYTWSDGQVGQNATGLPAGDITVTVTDGAGCTQNETFTVDEPLPITIADVITDASCNTGADGAIALTPSGGTGPYSYAWSNGNNSNNPTGLTAGTYTVTVTDNNGCTENGSYTVNEPTPIVITETINNVSCNGFSDGNASVVVSGGTPGYTYAWSNGATADNVSGLAAGAISITVTDNNGCPATENYTVGEPFPLVLTATISDETPCSSSNNGVIGLSVSGGTPGYSFAWSNGASSNPISGLTAGTYSVTVTDNNGCQTSNSYSVNEPTPLSVAETVTHVNCFGDSDGRIDLSVSDGQAPYNFAWSNGSSGSSPVLDNIPAGDYTVDVTDNNGCTVSKTIAVNEQPEIISNANVYNPTCHSTTPDGAIKINVTGGVPGYTYLWDTGSTSDSVFNITTGSYIVEITDAIGCVKEDTFDILIPSRIQATPSITNVSCAQTNDGAISVAVSGGTPGYSLNWSNGGTGNTITALDTGNYVIEMIDANNCIEYDTFYVDINNPIIIDSSVTHPTCFGSTDGSIDITVSGGVPGYSYSWSNGSTSEDLTGIGDGTYTIEVQDATNCLATLSIDVVEPAAKTITPIITDVSCNGGNDGEIFLTVSGGTAPYSFTWSNGDVTNNPTNLIAGTYNVVISDAGLCAQNANFTVNEPTDIATTGVITDPSCFASTFDGAISTSVSGGTPGYTYAWSNGETSPNIINLNSGTYSLIVTDNNGCTDSTGYDVINPPAIVTTPTITDLTCFESGDGNITITIAGGTPGYTTSWSNGQTNSNSIIALDSGTFWVDITDNNGCIERDSFTVSQPSPITFTGNTYDVSCASGTDGAARIFLTGGTAPYSYNWSSGETADTIFNKPVGNYVVTVTDNNGCSKDTTITVDGPQPFAFNEVVTSLSCFGSDDGSITLNPTGGTIPYSYNWTDGSTSNSITNLPIGDYGVVLTDVNGCSDSTGFTITQPLNIINNALINGINCNGGNDGAISISTIGGSGSYSYSWNTGATSSALTNLSAGDYILETTDGSGCIKTDTFTLNNPSLVDGSLHVTDTVCYGSSINVQAQLGSSHAPNANGSYSFDGGITFTDINTFSFVSPTPGDTLIQVVFRNAKGCISNVIDSLGHTLDTITADVSPIASPDCGGTLGQIQLNNIVGGSPLYNISFNGNAPFTDMDNDTIFEGLLPGTHSIEIVDSKGCTYDESVTFITSLVSTIDKTLPLCFGNCNGQITMRETTGGTAPYSYSLNDTIANPFTVDDSVFTGLCAGNYTIFIKDAVGCVAQFNTTLDDPAPVTVSLINKRNVTCNASGNGRITVQASGGTAPYKYKLNNDSTVTAGTATFSDLMDGNYSITITDANGCGAFYNFTILPSQDLVVTIIEDSPNSSCNANDGSAIINSITGGSGFYEFSLDGGTSFKDSAQIANELSKLASGYYIFITRDVSNGCLDTTTFVINEPGGVDMNAVNATISGPTCVANDGSIELSNITGGTPPYTYGIVGVSDPSQSRGQRSTPRFDDLITGFYYMTIIDANGCIYKYHFFIDAPLPLNIVASSSIELCNNSDGAINIIVSGGQTPYFVSINDTITDNGVGPFSFTDLPSGSYRAQVYDSSTPDSCAAGTTINIRSSRDDMIIVTDSTTCPEDSNGVMRIVGINKTGTGDYAYLYSVDDSTKSSFSSQTDYFGLSAGFHTLYVMQIDTSSIPYDTCIYADTETYYTPTDTTTYSNFIIFGPDEIEAGVKTTPTEPKEENGSIWVYSIDGGTPGYLMSLNDTLNFIPYDLVDSTTNVYDYLGMGDYNLYIRDSKGCEQLISVTIDPNLFISNVVTPNGDGDNDYFVVLGVDGAAQLTVYNRWGAVVYNSSNYESNWGGENVSSGVYFYELYMENGDSKNGWIHILR